MTLDELRKELDRIDRDILALVARRQELSAEIGKTKRASGLSPRSFTREKEVVDNARSNADALGISPDLAERLVVELIDASLTLQERDQVVSGGPGAGKRALVIGGAGKMGNWFVRFLTIQGFAVQISDPADPSSVDWRTAPLDHDVVIVAAPIRASAEILVELARRRPSGLVFDIASLKTPLADGLRAVREAGVRVASIHPMFGPDTELLSGRHVVIVDAGDPKAAREAEELFGSTMAVRVPMDLENHDRVMATVLGLSHALNIAFFTALTESGEAAPRLTEVSSTTFEKQQSIARGVAEENPRLYYEIQTLNRYGDDALASLQRAVETLRAVVRERNEEGFVKLMERGRSYWPGEKNR